MLTISMKCRKCGRTINYGWEQDCLLITLIPHECECETIVGTTNDEKPFLPGEVIEFSGERYDVVENHGDSGLVSYFDDLSHGFFPFKWTYEGEKCKRVK